MATRARSRLVSTATLSRLVRRAPLAAGAVAGCYGILLAPWLADTAGKTIFLTAGCGILAVVGIVSARWRWTVLVAVVFGFALLHGRTAGVRVPPVAGDRPLEVAGRVTSTPEDGAGGRTVAEMVVGEVASGADPGGRLAGSRFELVVGGADLHLRRGDRIRVRGTLQGAMPAANPGGFELDTYLERRGLDGRVEAWGEGAVEVLGRARLPDLGAVARRCREALGRTITMGIEHRPAAGALLKAMVLGMRDDAPPELEEAFRLSGTMHLFAVSGLHVGIFSTLVWGFLRICMVRRSTAVGFLVLAAFAYAFVTGWRPPAVRAAVMMALFLGAIYVHRPRHFLNSLGAAALIVLAFDTRQLVSPGFQLSFGVLVAIVFLMPVFSAPLLPFVRHDPLVPESLVPWHVRWAETAGRWGLMLFCGSLAAWVGSTPIIALRFGLITPLAVFANCLLLPAAYGILALAASSVALHAFGLHSLSGGINRVNAGLAEASISVATRFAELPGSHFRVGGQSLRREQGAATVTVLSTGGSSACQVIEPPIPGEPWLVDASTTFGYRAGVHPYLRRAAAPAVEGLILTHADSQHAGGALEAVREFGIGRLVLGPGAEASPAVVELLSSPLAPPAEPAVRGRRTRLSGGVELTYLAPFSARSDGLADDRCVVVLVVYQGWRILLMGDAGFETEKALLAAGGDLRCDVLVKGNHASDHSGTLEFVAAAEPRVVVANSAFFPAGEKFPPGWEDAIRARGIALFEQSRTGAVTLTLAPDRLVATAHLGGQTVVIRR